MHQALQHLIHHAEMIVVLGELPLEIDQVRGHELQALGEQLGEAYQIADDLKDVAGDPTELGKPTKQDSLQGKA